MAAEGRFRISSARLNYLKEGSERAPCHTRLASNLSSLKSRPMSMESQNARTTAKPAVSLKGR